MDNSTIMQFKRGFNEYTNIRTDVGIGTQTASCLHCHDMYEINIVLSGQEEIIFRNQKITLKEKEICIFRPYEVHMRKLDPAIETLQFCLAIKKECFEHALYFLGSSIDFSPVMDFNTPFIKKLHSSDMKFIYEHINNLYDHDEAIGNITNMDESELKIIILNLLSLCLKAEENTDYKLPMWLQQLNNDMNVPKNAALGIEALSRLSGKSSSTISHSFKQYFNMTPSQFVNDKRLKNAASLLTTSNDEILDIALNCGFGSLSYFYKRFQENYGISPKQYRIQNSTTK